MFDVRRYLAFLFTSEHTTTQHSHTHSAPSSIPRFMIISFLCVGFCIYYRAPRNCRVVVRNASLCHRRCTLSTVGTLDSRYIHAVPDDQTWRIINITRERKKKRRRKITEFRIGMNWRAGVVRIDKWFNWRDLEPQMQIWPWTDEVMRLRLNAEWRDNDSVRARVHPIYACLFTPVCSKGVIYSMFSCTSFRGKAVPDVHAIAWVNASTQKYVECVIFIRRVFLCAKILAIFSDCCGCWCFELSWGMAACSAADFPFNDMMNFIFTCRKLWQFLIYLFQLILYYFPFFPFIFFAVYFLCSISFALVQTHFLFFLSIRKKQKKKTKNKPYRIATEPGFALVHADAWFFFGCFVSYSIFSGHFSLVRFWQIPIGHYCPKKKKWNMWHALCSAITACGQHCGQRLHINIFSLILYFCPSYAIYGFMHRLTFIPISNVCAI